MPSNINVSLKPNKPFHDQPDGITVIGETQQLVLTALYLSNTNTFSISKIIVKLKELGYNVTHDMIFSAIKRMMKRGIVEKLKRGEYILTKDIEELVQNVKVIPKKAKGTRRKPKNISPTASRAGQGKEARSVNREGGNNSGDGNAQQGSGSERDSSGNAKQNNGKEEKRLLFSVTIPLDKFINGDYNINVNVYEVDDKEEGSVKQGGSAVGSKDDNSGDSGGNGFEIMFDNVKGIIGGEYKNWLSKKVGGRRWEWEDLVSFDKISYTEVDYVDKKPGVIPIFYTKIYYDKQKGWLIIEMLPPKGFVKKHGVAETVRMSIHELVTLIVYIARKLLYTVKGKLRKQYFEGLSKVVEEGRKRWWS